MSATRTVASRALLRSSNPAQLAARRTTFQQQVRLRTEGSNPQSGVYDKGTTHEFKKDGTTRSRTSTILIGAGVLVAGVYGYMLMARPEKAAAVAKASDPELVGKNRSGQDPTGTSTPDKFGSPRKA